MNAEQLSLWQEEQEKEQQPIRHSHIEVHYLDGTRAIFCSGNRQPTQYRKDEMYAGFVGPEQCQFCNPQNQGGLL